MRFLALVLTLLAGLFAPACVTVSEVDPPADATLATPSATTEYLRWALTPETNQRAAHVYNCLSEDLKERENLSLEDVTLGYGIVRDRILEILGDLEAVKVTAQRTKGPRRIEVDYGAGRHEATVSFVRETLWEITPTSRTGETALGDADAMGDILEYEDEDAVLRLKEVDPRISPEDIDRVVIDSGWRIDQLVDHNLRKLELGGVREEIDGKKQRARP